MVFNISIMKKMNILNMFICFLVVHPKEMNRHGILYGPLNLITPDYLIL